MVSRRVLTNTLNAANLSKLLLAVPDKKLEETTPEDFELMTAFYDEVKARLASAQVKNSSRWVAASKLTARKRPGLFPVRDTVVCGYLGILSLANRARDWYVFRHLMRNADVVRLLAELPARIEAAKGDRVIDLDTEPLRLLDAALWRYGKEIAGF